jgi:hypothetical protein
MNEQQYPLLQTGGRGMKLDPERLKSITATFAAAPQDGLGFAVFGVAAATNQMINVYWSGSHWTGLGVLFMAGALVAYFLYFPRYYASRFGWVQQKPPTVNRRQQVGLVIVIGLAVTMLLSADLLQHFAQAPVNYLTLLQSVLLLCVNLGIAFTARGRSMPIRLTIWAALVSTQGVVAVLPLWISLGPRQMLLWKLLNAGSAGILFMVMGLCNHVAMVRMLPKRVEEGDDD